MPPFSPGIGPIPASQNCIRESGIESLNWFRDAPGSGAGQGSLGIARVHEPAGTRAQPRCITDMTNEPAAQVTIAGAGGIGCALGHALCAGGVDVTFVDADERKIAWGLEHGVGIDGRPSIPAKFTHFASWRPEPAGIVLLCTKCYDNRAVLERLTGDCEVIPVQNGFDRELVGRCRIEGIASFVSECHPGQTQTRITRAGDLHVGFSGADPKGELPEHVGRLVDTLQSHGSFDVKRVPTILPYKYAKLMYNAAISPLAAAAGLDNGALLTHGKAREMFFALLRENYGILKAAGVTLGQVGPFHPDTVDRILRWPFVARAMAWPFSKTLHGTYCSMSGDIPTGRTEIENFNGHLIELAGDRACELNQTVLALVKRMAEMRESPALRWLDQIAPAGDARARP